MAYSIIECHWRVRRRRRYQLDDSNNLEEQELKSLINVNYYACIILISRLENPIHPLKDTVIHFIEGLTQFDVRNWILLNDIFTVVYFMSVWI